MLYLCLDFAISNIFFEFVPWIELYSYAVVKKSISTCLIFKNYISYFYLHVFLSTNIVLKIEISYNIVETWICFCISTWHWWSVRMERTFLLLLSIIPVFRWCVHFMSSKGFRSHTFWSLFIQNFHMLHHIGRLANIVLSSRYSESISWTRFNSCMFHREIEKFIIRQPPIGEKDDYDSENSWISHPSIPTNVRLLISLYLFLLYPYTRILGYTKRINISELKRNLQDFLYTFRGLFSSWS